MSGTDYFDDGFAINAYMDDKVPIDAARATAEHAEIADCLTKAGIKVTKTTAPANCQDGVYTANWALVVGNKAILSNLPNKRQDEEPHAQRVLQDLGLDTIKLPGHVPFSGQGDALVCGDYLFIGSNYRTDIESHALIQNEVPQKVVSLLTVPQLDDSGKPVINRVTGWPDSFFYDLDLALAVISPTCIAWCPAAFTPQSQAIINQISDIEKIEVSLDEATRGFACNLVSTGSSVVMSDHAPELKSNLINRGLTIYTPHVTELLKGGGFIRCTTLTLS